MSQLPHQSLNATTVKKPSAPPASFSTAPALPVQLQIPNFAGSSAIGFDVAEGPAFVGVPSAMLSPSAHSDESSFANPPLQQEGGLKHPTAPLSSPAAVAQSPSLSLSKTPDASPSDPLVVPPSLTPPPPPYDPSLATYRVSSPKTDRVAVIQIDLDESTNSTINQRSILDADRNGTLRTIRVYDQIDVIRGKVCITPRKSFGFKSIAVELVGQSVWYDRSGSISPFLTLRRELEGTPGTIVGQQVVEYPFEIRSEKEYESYRGIQADLEYLVRVTIERPVLRYDVVAAQNFWVMQVVDAPTEGSGGIQKEVGIEGILRVSIRLDQTCVDIGDPNAVLTGILTFFEYAFSSQQLTCDLVVLREEKTPGQEQNREDLLAVSVSISDVTAGKWEEGNFARRFAFPIGQIPDRFRTVSDSALLRGCEAQFLFRVVFRDLRDRKFFKQWPIQFYRSRI